MIERFLPHFIKFGLFALLTLSYSYICYMKGYNARSEEYQSLYEQALQKKTDEFIAQLDEARKTAEEDALAKYKRDDKNQEVKIITQTVVEYVDREIQVPVGCTDLATSINGMLVESTNSVARITNSQATANRPWFNDSL